MTDLSKTDLHKVPADQWTEAHDVESERRLAAQRAAVRERMKLGNWHLDEDDFVIDSTTGEIIGPHPDAGEYWGEVDMTDAKPFAEAFPELAESIRRGRGRPPSENPKRAIKLRLDADVVERFKAGGPGWQTRMNEALRKAVGLR